MRTRHLLTAVVMAAVPGLSLGADPSSFDLTLSAWLASTRQGVQSFKSGSGCSLPSGENICTSGMLSGPLSVIGLSAIGRMGRYEAGLLFDGSFEYDTFRTNDDHLGVLLGLAYEPVRWVRLEGLAEFGSHRVSDIGSAGINANQGDVSVALPYVGVRPSASFRIGVVGPVRFVLGLETFARLDVGRKEAVVSSKYPAASARYEVGGWSLGLATRFGLEL